MATYNYLYDSFGTFVEYIGITGENDTANVTIGTNFSGTIAIQSHFGDGEIESVNLTLPTDWVVTLTSSTTTGSETPIYTQNSYEIFDDLGSSVGTISIDANIINAPCYARGTRILCDKGCWKPIEGISVGDLVMTYDRGLQPVTWAGVSQVSSSCLEKSANLYPVRIQAGALGHGLPSRNLMVSRQHRLLISSKISARVFEHTEVLIPAIKLVGYPGIEVADDITDVIYLHLLFDQHELIWAEGALSESLLVGRQAIKALNLEARQQIVTLFPEIAEKDFTPKPARFVAERGGQVRQLMQRQLKNNVPLTAGNYPMSVAVA